MWRLNRNRLFVHKMVRFTGYFCEVCSFPYTGFQKFAKSIVSGEDEEAEVSNWMKRVQSRLGALLIRKESMVKSPLDMSGVR